MPVTAPRRTSVTADHRAIASWLGEVVQGVDVTPQLGDAPDDDGRIDLVLVEVADAEDRRPDRDLPVRVHLTYVVAPAHADGSVAGDWLAQILLATRDAADIELAEPATEVGWWLAMGVHPRPHARLRTLLLLDRSQPPTAPLVTEPLHVEVTRRGALSGSVVAEDGHPLAGAAIHLVDLAQRADADRHGRFSFPSVPTDHALALAVTHRGTTYGGTVPAGAEGHQTIRCTVTESVG